MILLVGNHWRGKSDQVDGLFHVATYFGTVWFLPFVPEQTFLIVENLVRFGQSPTQIPIPCSWKSVLLAYTRGGLLVWLMCCLALLVFGLFHDDGLNDKNRSLTQFLAAVVGISLLMLLATYCRWFTRARPKRALQLARIANIAPQEVAAHFVRPDQIDAFLVAHLPRKDQTDEARRTGRGSDRET